ncbi:MAG: hypothetical protein ACOWYE_07560 [Desulfatiglandales bacterium]
MVDVITRIMDIEKRSAKDIQRAEEISQKNIEAHRRTLEEEKDRVHEFIIKKEQDRLTQTLHALNNQIEEASKTAEREYETLFQDSATVDAIKERIAAILLTG